MDDDSFGKLFCMLLVLCYGAEGMEPDRKKKILDQIIEKLSENEMKKEKTR